MSLRLPPPLERPLARGPRRRRGSSCATATRSWRRARPAELLLDVPDAISPGRGGRRVGRRAASTGAATTPSPPASPAARSATPATGMRLFPGALRRRHVRGRLDARRVARRRHRPRAPRVRLGGARLPDQRAGRELRHRPADGARAADGAARLLGAGRRAARDRCPGRSPWTGRKHHAACALFDSDGRLLCASRGALDRVAAGVGCTHGAPLPNLSVLRSDLRTRGRDGGNGGGVGPRRRAGRAQPRLHLPQGVRAQAAARGPRPPDHAAGPPRRRAGRGDLGRGVRGDRPAPVAAARRARPQRRRRLHRQPQRPQPVGARVRAGVAARARHARTSTRRRPSTRCPSRSAPG